MARCLSRAAPRSAANAVEVYDIATNTWSAGTAAPDEFLLAGYQQVGQFLYVVGGFGPECRRNNMTTTWRLDMSSAPGTWDTGPAFTPAGQTSALPTTRQRTSCMRWVETADGGGFFDSTNLVDELDLSGWPGGTWTSSTPNLPSPNRQANQAGFYGGGNIWSVGGLNGSTFTFLPDVLFRPSCTGPATAARHQPRRQPPAQHQRQRQHLQLRRRQQQPATAYGDAYSNSHGDAYSNIDAYCYCAAEDFANA